MRLCLFTPNFLPAVGGTEFVTDALARQFHALGHHVVVLARGTQAKLDVPYRVEWFPKPILPRVWPERVGRHLAALHERERFDLFVANYAHPTGYAALRVGQRVGVPTVIISHGGDLYRSSNDRKRPHLWKRTVHAYNHADGLIAISPYIRTLIEEINPQPHLIELIPNGIHLAPRSDPADRPADFTDPRKFLLCLGNLGPMKGFDDAIAAFAACRTKLGEIALVIVGKGPLEESLRQQVVRLGLDRDVIFVGQRTGSDKRWFLHHCQFGLMPSIEEGHPIVGLEFLAVGKPIICSTNPAFDAMYTHGENCLRTPAQRPDLLAEAIVAMNSMELSAMSAVSRNRAAEFDWPIIARRYLAFFERVIAAR